MTDLPEPIASPEPDLPDRLSPVIPPPEPNNRADAMESLVSAGTTLPTVERIPAPSLPAAAVTETDDLTAMTESDDFQDLSFAHHPRLGDRSSGQPPWGRVPLPDVPLTLLILAIATLLIGIGLGWARPGLGWLGTIGALLAALRILVPAWGNALARVISSRQAGQILATLGLGVALWGLVQLTGFGSQIYRWGQTANWDAIGALGEVFGALGQILIAILAVYVAWRQYKISKDLTIQQNTITQQQTIDSYFQGISELVLDEEGLLEDWPQERAIAEGRTAAILGSIDATGKAKIIRFLSRSRLLTPLKRDRRLGRAIFDGMGGYQEDRLHGVRVIDLGVMLAKADLQGTDLRWVDLSEANLFRANLSHCDLFKANLSRCILYEANLRGTDLKGAQLFYGPATTATPRSRTEPPDYHTGAHTGAVVEGANFSQVQRLSDEQRYYCCAWGGEKTRRTIPGGCEGIPNLLEQALETNTIGN
ncbi:pentapeptide repeat-containing protein [Trichothermofontia sp.]